MSPGSSTPVINQSAYPPGTIFSEDGTTATSPDGTITQINPDGTVTTTSPDGTITVTDANGNVISVTPPEDESPGEPTQIGTDFSNAVTTFTDDETWRVF